MKRLFTLLFLLLSQICCAQLNDSHVVYLTYDSLKGSYELNRHWLFHNGDDTAWAAVNYNDSGWQQLSPALQLQDGADKKFDGIGWFRLHIYADSSLADKPLAIRLSHYGASEIYLDGRLIRKYGVIHRNTDSSEYYDPHGFPHAIKTLSPGRHVLAVRYANHYAHKQWSSYKKTNAGFGMVIGSANTLFTRYKNMMALSGVGLLLLSGFFVALGLSHFLLWIYYRRLRSNLYFCIFSLGMGTAFYLPYVKFISNNPTQTMYISYLGMMAASIITLGLSGVSNELFGNSKSRFKIMAALSIIPLLLCFFFFQPAVLFYLVVIVIITLESIILTIKAIIRKVPGARIVGGGILFTALFFFVIITVSLIDDGAWVDGEATGKILLVLAVPAILSIPVSMSVFLAMNFAGTIKNLDHQLHQVQVLSEKTREQEHEKQRYLETEKERLEEEVAVRTAEIVSEKQKSDDLLRNILPEEVANELKQKGSSEAKYFDHVTVIFTDFVDFTKAGERFTPQQLVDELHTCFKAFDDIASKYNIEKIKTIGDAYLAVSGLPAADKDHAINTVLAALEIKQYMNGRKRAMGDKTFDIRIGLHSGAVVAGIVGVKKFAYDIWGDTVNTAARMEQSSLPDKINISQTTYELVKDKFNCTYRGEIAAKNKGDVKMYFVDGLKESTHNI